MKSTDLPTRAEPAVEAELLAIEARLGAACEAVASEGRGVLPLSDDLCGWVTDRFRELVPEA